MDYSLIKAVLELFKITFDEVLPKKVLMEDLALCKIVNTSILR